MKVNFILPAGVCVPFRLIPTIPNCFSFFVHHSVACTILIQHCQRPDNNCHSSLSRFVPVCHKVSIYHSFLQLFARLAPQNVHDLFKSFALLPCPNMRTVFFFFFSQFYLMQSPSQISQVVAFFRFHQDSMSELDLLPRTSQGRSGPTSLNLSVFISWGFCLITMLWGSSLLHHFLICNWLAISSGYICSHN